MKTEKVVTYRIWRATTGYLCTAKHLLYSIPLRIGTRT